MLEGKLNGETLYQMNECMNRFFDRSEDSCNPNEFPDLFKLKLRGGGSNHKVAIKSKHRMLDCVLSLLRDMVPLWQGNEMKSHPLCDHKLQPNCFYCLLRSLSLRSMNPKVRTPISAYEVFKYLEDKNLENMELQDMVKSLMGLLVTSEEKVSSMCKSISMYCDQCDKDIFLQDNEILELKVCDEGTSLQEVLNRHLQQKV